MEQMLDAIAVLAKCSREDAEASINEKATDEGKDPLDVAKDYLAELQAPVVTVQPSAAITVVNDNRRSRALATITPEQAKLLKAAGRMPADATPVEMDYAFATANRLGLDPMRKQIQFIRFEKKGPLEPYITIGGLEAIAARSGDWAGADMPVLERDENGQLLSASVTVYRIVHGVRCGFSARAVLGEFAKKSSYTWPTMPTHMLEKVALANALKMAFPEEIGDLYVEEEVK